MTAEKETASGGEPEAAGEEKDAKNTRQPHCSTIPSVFQAPSYDEQLQAAISEQFLINFNAWLDAYCQRNNVTRRARR